MDHKFGWGLFVTSQIALLTVVAAVMDKITVAAFCLAVSCLVAEVWFFRVSGGWVRAIALILTGIYSTWVFYWITTNALQSTAASVNVWTKFVALCLVGAPIVQVAIGHAHRLWPKRPSMAYRPDGTPDWDKISEGISSEAFGAIYLEALKQPPPPRPQTFDFELRWDPVSPKGSMWCRVLNHTDIVTRCSVDLKHIYLLDGSRQIGQGVYKTGGVFEGDVPLQSDDGLGFGLIELVHHDSGGFDLLRVDKSVMFHGSEGNWALALEIRPAGGSPVRFPLCLRWSRKAGLTPGDCPPPVKGLIESGLLPETW